MNDLIMNNSFSTMVKLRKEIAKCEQSLKCFTVDEAFFNDLLQCCVCLEQLDNSSKVLPCQHTFCKRCLQEILNSRNELRCPECRRLVDAKIEELPCNTSLIRLLERIKNVRQKKVGCSTNIAPRSTESSSSSQQQASPHAQLSQPMGNERMNNSFSTMVELGKEIEICEQSVKCFILDEAFLNDLLECYVCLEQLNNSSKVLPCQHTFCKRCLHEILNSHKELKCPECRILVDAKIEELPCNVLLIRLLEGIKSVQLKKDFDLRFNCYDKGFSCLDEDSSTCDQKQTNLQESRVILIHRCIKFLIHACQCKDANCRSPGCQKMKKIIKHARSCKKPKTSDGCAVCKQLISLCCYHAKYCQEAECPVPFCPIIKDKLKHQQLQQRLQQAQILKRHIATMQNREISNAIPQTSHGNSNSSSQPLPVAQPDSSPHPSQSRIGMQPSSGPPVGALQAVQQVQAAAARQTAAHMVAASVSYGNVNPVIISPVANTGSKTAIQQMQNPIPQTMSGVFNRMLNVGNVACWEASSYAQNSQPRQNPQPQPAHQLGGRQQAHIIRPGIVPNSIGNSSIGPPQVMPSSEPTLGGVPRHTQIAWQQFLQAVKSPSTPEKQQKALGILKSNPELMAMFIKQKTAGYQKQVQLRQQVLINEENMITPSLQNGWHEQQHQQQQHQQHFLTMQQQQPNQLPNKYPLGIRQQAHIRPGIVPNSIGNSSMGPPQNMPNSESVLGGMQRHTQIAWQHFLQAVKSPSTPEKQQTALGILESNPELMDMFIKQNTSGYQKQQQPLQQMLINERNVITPSSQNVCHEHQQQQHFLVMQQQQPNQLPHPQPTMHSKRPRMENPYEF